MSGERLAKAHSPYLAAHAEDPVDWYSWGADAFERASAERRPILLSVGYSSCHWCHVMQRESFRDEATAAYLNDHFVAVKVDREERPDVDALYMDYVAATTGSGGWPMTVFLTPQLLPVLGGTYFPREPVAQMPSFMSVLADVVEAMAGRPEEVEEAAEWGRRFLEEQSEPPEPEEVTFDVVSAAADALIARADDVNGGFGQAPKFPMLPVLIFLLRFGQAAHDERADTVAREALLAMVRGGIYDQVAGGLFRYATDEAWLVPHFEKMLYDNGLLLSALAAAHSASPDEELRHIALQTAEFLGREMTLDDGLLGSALDAETDGVEGATYVWTYEELADALTAEELEHAEKTLGVTPEGVWEERTILTRREGRGADAAQADAILAKLMQMREGRSQPARDDKAVTSWNALAATGLLEAGVAFEEETLVAQGLGVLDALFDSVVDGADVIHVAHDPAVADVRLLEDYAALALASLAAHGATVDEERMDAATELVAASLDLFYEDGEVHMVADDTDLPVRPADRTDSPTPSGPSMLAEVGVRLHGMTGDDEYLEIASSVAERRVGAARNAAPFAATALSAMLAMLEDER